MTKQEKIQESYGRFYDAQRYHYSVNGWTDPEHYTEKEMEEMMHEINMEFGEHRCRPKSLSGIEDNNGWIKIESEKDFPEGGNYWVIMPDGDIRYHFLISKPSSVGFTHYKPIKKPQLPIY